MQCVHYWGMDSHQCDSAASLRSFIVDMHFKEVHYWGMDSHLCDSAASSSSFIVDICILSRSCSYSHYHSYKPHPWPECWLLELSTGSSRSHREHIILYSCLTAAWAYLTAIQWGLFEPQTSRSYFLNNTQWLNRLIACIIILISHIHF